MKKLNQFMLLISGFLLCTSSWAGECQVTLSRPDIDLGEVRGSIPDENLFAPFYVDVSVRCDSAGPVRMKFEGMNAGSTPERYSLGATGTLSLRLTDISLEESNGGRVHIQIPGHALKTLPVQEAHLLSEHGVQEIILPPETELTVFSVPGKSAGVNVSMRLCAKLPPDRSLRGVRDKTALNAQIRIRAIQ